MSQARFVIGIDEVGRGALAGPLCLGAVLIRKGSEKKLFPEIRDSKKLSKKQREKWVKALKVLQNEGEVHCTSIFVSSATIDRIGLSKACDQAVSSLLRRLVRKLSITEVRDLEVLLDAGLRAPSDFDYRAIIKGDEREPVIAAASIVAKVRRDRYMYRLAKMVLHYGFEKNVGYGTKLHRDGIKKNGLSDHHRKSWNI